LGNKWTIPPNDVYEINQLQRILVRLTEAHSKNPPKTPMRDRRRITNPARFVFASGTGWL